MLHFRKVIASWTDPSLGNCSYLDTCRHMKTCKYIHYELDDETQETGATANKSNACLCQAVFTCSDVLMSAFQLHAAW